MVRKLETCLALNIESAITVVAAAYHLLTIILNSRLVFDIYVK
jgi:hypothetical protein